MPQDLYGRLFNGLGLLIWRRPRNGTAKCRSQTGYDSFIVPSQIIQLDGFRYSIVLFGMLSSANQDFYVIVSCRGQLE